MHIDFSQNYACKHAQEIQSAHFGSSKSQISFHIICVFYYKNGRQHKSFVTMIDDLTHNTNGIWFHLEPVLLEIKKLLNSITALHSASDGSITQYRNKLNFIFMIYFGKLHSISFISWHFTEPGHGKSAADEIGGKTKSDADQAIASGHDIINT